MFGVFCLKCGDFRDYDIDLRHRTAEDRDGLVYEYTEIEARCKVCHEEVYVPILNDQNVVTRMEAHREAIRKKEEEKRWKLT